MPTSSTTSSDLGPGVFDLPLEFSCTSAALDDELPSASCSLWTSTTGLEVFPRSTLLIDRSLRSIDPGRETLTNAALSFLVLFSSRPTCFLPNPCTCSGFSTMRPSRVLALLPVTRSSFSGLLATLEVSERFTIARLSDNFGISPESVRLAAARSASLWT